MKLLIYFLFLINAYASDAVIEILVSDYYNEFYNTKNKMHLTIGHVKNVDEQEIIEAINYFNIEFEDLLHNSIKEGFVVRNFNLNGFNNGYHILDADESTTNKLSYINLKLYEFLKTNYNVILTDKTLPKNINISGYTPHLEFLENDKIANVNDKIYFTTNNLLLRIQ